MWEEVGGLHLAPYHEFSETVIRKDIVNQLWGAWKKDPAKNREDSDSMIRRSFLKIWGSFEQTRWKNREKKSGGAQSSSQTQKPDRLIGLCPARSSNTKTGLLTSGQIGENVEVLWNRGKTSKNMLKQDPSFVDTFPQKCPGLLTRMWAWFIWEGFKLVHTRMLSSSAVPHCSLLHCIGAAVVGAQAAAFRLSKSNTAYEKWEFVPCSWVGMSTKEMQCNKASMECFHEMKKNEYNPRGPGPHFTCNQCLYLTEIICIFEIKSKLKTTPETITPTNFFLTDGLENSRRKSLFCWFCWCWTHSVHTFAYSSQIIQIVSNEINYSFFENTRRGSDLQIECSGEHFKVNITSPARLPSVSKWPHPWFRIFHAFISILIPSLPHPSCHPPFPSFGRFPWIFP